MPVNWPPGWESAARSAVGKSNARAVNALLIAMSTPIRSVHANVRDEVAAGVDDGDVLRLPDLARAVLTGSRRSVHVLERQFLARW